MKIHLFKSWINKSLSSYWREDGVITHCLRAVTAKDTTAFQKKITCKHCLKLAPKRKGKSK